MLIEDLPVKPVATEIKLLTLIDTQFELIQVLQQYGEDTTSEWASYRSLIKELDKLYSKLFKGGTL
jgi:hypothetical protein